MMSGNVTVMDGRIPRCPECDADMEISRSGNYKCYSCDEYNRLIGTTAYHGSSRPERHVTAITDAIKDKGQLR